MGLRLRSHLGNVFIQDLTPTALNLADPHTRVLRAQDGVHALAARVTMRPWLLTSMLRLKASSWMNSSPSSCWRRTLWTWSTSWPRRCT